MIKDSIEYLIKIATNPPYSNNLLAARQEYQKYAGGILHSYEHTGDAHQFTRAISSFLEQEGAQQIPL